MKKLDVFFQRYVPLLIVLGVLAILFISIEQGRRTSENNNAYLKVVNCIISVPAAKRTSVDIENCYGRVERDLNVSIKRYDNIDK